MKILEMSLPLPSTSLKFRVVVYSSIKSAALAEGVGRSCRAACRPLCWTGDAVFELLFLRNHLTFENVVHECVHAAFAVQRRLGARPYPHATHCSEEQLAYPAGEIANAVMNALFDAGMAVKTTCRK